MLLVEGCALGIRLINRCMSSRFPRYSNTEHPRQPTYSLGVKGLRLARFWPSQAQRLSGAGIDIKDWGLRVVWEFTFAVSTSSVP